MKTGYLLMDRGVVHGIRQRSATVAGPPARKSAIIRWSLGGLLAFGALNAFGGGYYGLSGAEGVPLEWLNGSPFTDYAIPSLILLVVVGGCFLVAATAVFAGTRIARFMAFTAGFVVLGWLAVQVEIIGYVSWMQPTTAIAGVLILILAWKLPSEQS
jgi:hypothetical protein